MTEYATMLADRRRDQYLQHAGDDITAAQNYVNRVLVWGHITDDQRAQLTQAANALDLARACVSYIGPRKPVKIGF